jgi:peptidoglycan/LPS O-acetylase OafA/YrhL
MGKRLHELDSLRGLAAFAVMLSHLLIVFPIAWNTSEPAGAVWWIKLVMFSPLRVVWAGHEAVIFFFILSGFVLALLFFGGREAPPYRLYLVKRIIRIYPPYLVAALSAMILRELFFKGPIPSVSDWFNQSWQSQVTPSTLLDHFTMIGSYNNCAFNPVLWSLVHEMRISIIFPLIVWALIKHERLCLVLPLAFTLVYCLSISLKFRGLIAFDHDYFATLHYTGFFIVGAFLAKYREQIVETALKIPGGFKWLLLGGAVLFYTNAFYLPYYVTPQTGSFALLLRKLWFQEWITAIGVLIFIILALSSGSLSGILATKPLQFLGSISYSLYLFHALVLKVVVTVFSKVLPMPAVLGISLVLALVIATASWRYIEVPSIQLGKTITKRWYRKVPKRLPEPSP